DFPDNAPETWIPAPQRRQRPGWDSFLRAVAGVAYIRRGFGSLSLGSERRFAANHASRQRFSRARAYWGGFVDVSDRLRHRTDHRTGKRIRYAGNRTSARWD